MGIVCKCGRISAKNEITYREEVNEIVTMPVPNQARLPVYSSWYAYRYAISDTVLKVACRRAKALGLEGVIVDDGWQIEPPARDYAYCGDWELMKSKFSDMRAHGKQYRTHHRRKLQNDVSDLIVL